MLVAALSILGNGTRSRYFSYLSNPVNRIRSIDVLSESIAAQASILLHDAHSFYFFVQYQGGLMGLADVPRPAITPTAFARFAVWLLVQKLYRYDSTCMSLTEFL